MAQKYESFNLKQFKSSLDGVDIPELGGFCRNSDYHHKDKKPKAVWMTQLDKGCWVGLCEVCKLWAESLEEEILKPTQVVEADVLTEVLELLDNIVTFSPIGYLNTNNYLICHYCGNQIEGLQGHLEDCYWGAAVSILNKHHQPIN